MADKSQLLESIKSRKSRSGIITADRWFRSVEECFEGGVCPVGVKDFSQEQWNSCLKEAESQFTYTGPEVEYVKGSISEPVGSGIATIVLRVTTPDRDRDGDIILTEGVDLDMKSPFLVHHMPMQPIGGLVDKLKHDKKELLTRMVFADIAIARDALKLFKVGGLRVSHGFEPVEWDALDDEKGWLFKKIKIYEISGVSIPSNIRGEAISIEEKGFETDLFKGLVHGITGERIVLKSEECTCQKHKQKSLFEVDENTKEVAETLAEIRAEVLEEITEIPEKTEVLEEKSIPDFGELFEKAGTRLSSATRSELSEALADIQAISETDGLPRGVMALASSAMNCINELLGEEEKSFEQLEQLYFAELVKSNAGTLRRVDRHVKTILSVFQEREEAEQEEREWGDVLSSLLN